MLNVLSHISIITNINVAMVNIFMRFFFNLESGLLQFGNANGQFKQNYRKPQVHIYTKVIVTVVDNTCSTLKAYSHVYSLNVLYSDGP